jgi:hypothetical protein
MITRSIGIGHSGGPECQKGEGPHRAGVLISEYRDYHCSCHNGLLTHVFDAEAPPHVFCVFFTTPMSQTDNRTHHWGMSPIHSQSPHLLQVVTHTPILRPLTPSCPTHYLCLCVPHARLMSVRSLCHLVASDPLSLSPLELEQCISAHPSVPPSVHPSPHAHYYIVS